MQGVTYLHHTTYSICSPMRANHFRISHTWLLPLPFPRRKKTSEIRSSVQPFFNRKKKKKEANKIRRGFIQQHSLHENRSIYLFPRANSTLPLYTFFYFAFFAREVKICGGEFLSGLIEFRGGEAKNEGWRMIDVGLLLLRGVEFH